MHYLPMVLSAIYTRGAKEVLVDSVSQFSCSLVFDSLRPQGVQQARPPCPSPTPRVYADSCPLSQ